MPRLRPVVWTACVLIFAAGMLPPEHPSLMAIGLIGFFAACFIPKDF